MKHIIKLTYRYQALILYCIILTVHCFSQDTFQKIIEGNNPLLGYTIELTEDGGFIVAGHSENSILGDKDIIIIKFDSQGIIEWSKVYGGSANDYPRAVIQTNSMEFIVIASTYSFGYGDEDILAIKLDINGNIIWSKTFGGNNEDRGFSLQQTSENGFIIGGSTQSFGAGQRDAYIIKINNNGEITWTRVIGGVNLDNCFNIKQTLDSGYIFTGTEESFGPGAHSLLLTKLSSNGNIEWSKAIGGNIEEHARIVSQTQDNGYVLLGHTLTWGAGSWDPIVVKTDNLGNIQWAKTYGGYSEEFIGNIITLDNGGYAICGSTTTFGNGPRDIFIINIDSFGELIGAITYGGNGSEEIPFGGDNALSQMSDGNFLLVGQSNSFTEQNSIYIVKSDASGISGCNETNFTPTISDVTPQSNNASTTFFTGNNSQFVSIQSAVLEINDTILCETSNLIANFLVSDTVICMGDCINYFDSSYFNPTSWNWFFEGGVPSFSSLQNPNDICYLNEGSFDVKLVVSNQYSTDTILLEEFINVLPKPIINLGSDTSMCSNQPFILDPGIGFNSYFWQDGSTDTSFTVNTSGTYWVEVTDINGCSSSDTIQIDLFPNPEVNLGNDTLICSNQPMVLDPGIGFTDYLWQDGSSDSSFFVYTSGLFWVEVTDINGCSASDTIHIDLYPAPEIDLGNDTLICLGDQLVLNAGGGFISYLWNTGSTDSTIIIDTTGLYIVEVFSTFGCSAVDSILVEIYPLAFEDLELGSDTTFCPGEGFVLNAGSGYTYYQWQDGSSDSVFIADTAGVYWVYVENPCSSGSDTIVLNVFPLSVVDLGNDTAVCHDESILLDAGFGFLSYLWQDGTSNQFLYANQTGAYWVEIMDGNGCSVNDTINLEFILLYPDIGSDTAICSGDSITFFASDEFVSYLWQNGSDDISLTAGTEGLIWCEVMDTIGCDGTDSVYLEILFPPLISLGNDTVFCVGDSLWLNAIPWSNAYDISYKNRIG